VSEALSIPHFRIRVL